MIISDDFEIVDEVSGLKLKVIAGTNQNRLHIEHVSVPMTLNQDFWFTLDGKLDRTGSDL